MGSVSLDEGGLLAAQYQRQSFQLSFSELNLETRLSSLSVADGGDGTDHDNSGSTDLFLSEDAQNAVRNAEFAADLARRYNEDDIAEETDHGLAAFVHELQDLLGAGGGKPAEGFRGIGQQVAERARQMGESLFEQSGRTDFSFREVSVEVSMESFDLRVNTEEGETNLQIERLSLSVSVTEISGSLSSSETLSFAGENSGEEDNDEAAATQTEAIAQLLERFPSIQSVERSDPANLLRLFTDFPLLGNDGQTGFFTDPAGREVTV